MNVQDDIHIIICEFLQHNKTSLIILFFKSYCVGQTMALIMKLPIRVFIGVGGIGGLVFHPVGIFPTGYFGPPSPRI
tara:strand:- start:55756 stop:55986 length:231 start_codon:yes stop_codon:yes gene_type:complete